MVNPCTSITTGMDFFMLVYNSQREAIIPVVFLPNNWNHRIWKKVVSLSYTGRVKVV